MKKITIAIDGYSACGKSTLAKVLAKKLDYKYIDSGAMYRAVTYYALSNDITDQNGISISELENKLSNIQIDFIYDDVAKISFISLNGEIIEDQIRTMEVSSNVSIVAKSAKIRKKMVDLQREMSAQGGVVMDGRDIGTVVFPKAELKLFITANIDIRTQRRYDELNEKETSSLSEVKNNLLERDRIDTTREISPLVKADDAIEIDNSYLSKDEFFDLAFNYALKKIKNT